jgi:hypothetical protein
MAAENTVVLQDLASLRRWQRQLRITLRVRDLPSASFALKELPPDWNRSFSALAAELHRACGCGSGAFFTLAAMAVAVVAYFASGNQLSDFGFAHIILFLAITVPAAWFGRIFGLLWSRWRLLRLADRAISMVSTKGEVSVTT